MAKSGAQRVLDASRHRRSTRYSAIYRWLWAGHARLTEAFALAPPSWIDVAAEIYRDGVSSASGKVPDRKAVRQVWVRVCRDMAKFEQLRARAADTRRPVNRSPAKAGSGHRFGFPQSPQAVRGTLAETGLPPANSSVSFAPAPAETMSAHAKAEYAKLDEMFRQADRYLGTAPAIRKRS